MKKTKLILNPFAAIMLFIVGVFFLSAISDNTGMSNDAILAVSLIGTVAFIVGTFVMLKKGFNPISNVAMSGLLTEVWVKQIQENLYMGNDFMRMATDHSMWVANEKVNVPQAGANAAVEKNRTSLPAPVAGRTDTNLSYNLSQYTTDAVVIQNFEAAQIAYDKRTSVLFNIMSSLQFVVATQTLYAWAPSGSTRIVQTSGSTSTLNLPHSTATGSRKMSTIADITALKAILDKDNIPQQGRILLVPQYMYNVDLLNIAGIVQAQQFGSAVAPNGVVARLMGFDIMIRSEVLVYDNTGTPVIKAIDGDGTLSAPAATDQGAAIAFHPSYVCHAVGSIIPYADSGSNGTGSPLYFGHLFSAEVWHGASKLRTDQKGIVALVQGT